MCFQQSQCQSNTCLQHKLWPLKACGLLGWPPGTGKAPPLAGRASYSEPKATSCTKLWIPKLRITHYLGKTQATKETGNQGDLPGTLQKHHKKKKLQEAVSTKTGFFVVVVVQKLELKSMHFYHPTAINHPAPLPNS